MNKRIEISEKITERSRELIKEIEKYFKSHNIPIISTDTDGLYVNIQGKPFFYTYSQLPIKDGKKNDK